MDVCARLITSAFGPATSVFLLATPSEHPVTVGVLHIPPHTCVLTQSRKRPSLDLTRLPPPPPPHLSSPPQKEPDRVTPHLPSYVSPLTSLSPPSPSCFNRPSDADSASSSQTDPCWTNAERKEKALKSQCVPACQSWQEVSDRCPDRQGSCEQGHHRSHCCLS